MLIFILGCSLIYPLEQPPVAIKPADPADEDDLVGWVSDADDPHDQGGAIEGYHLIWTQDGVEREDLEDSFTVPASETAEGETWEVFISAFRGDEVSEPGNASAEVGP